MCAIFRTLSLSEMSSAVQGINRGGCCKTLRYATAPLSVKMVEHFEDFQKSSIYLKTANFSSLKRVTNSSSRIKRVTNSSSRKILHEIHQKNVELLPSRTRLITFPNQNVRNFPDVIFFVIFHHFEMHDRYSNFRWSQFVFCQGFIINSC